MAELVGGAGQAQQPSLIGPVQRRAETQRPGSADSSDHDSDVITNPHTGAYPAKCEPERNRESA